MRADAEQRKGWCPGILRPMQTGDGLLLRVRPRVGTLSLPQLAAIADAAALYGSGQIDLTNRANVQVRGLTEETYPEARTALAKHGLVDASAAVEAVRNVSVDPLSGLDPGQRDLRPVAVELERCLATRPDLHALPPKFAFHVTGAVSAAESRSPADITVSSLSDLTSAIWIDGERARVLAVKPGDAAAAACAIAATFAAAAAGDPGLRRIRDWVAAAGSDAVFAQAGCGATLSAGLGRRGVAPAMIGALAATRSEQGSGAGVRPCAVGLGLPFGRIAAVDLAHLCRMVAGHGITEARVSSDRALVFPVDRATVVDQLLADAAGMGLITEPADPRLTMDVCPGAPSCRQAAAETRGMAAQLAAALISVAQRPTIHISGCAKGCARRAPAAFTFVARGGGFDLVRDGTAGGPVSIEALRAEDIVDACLRGSVGTR